MNKSEYSEEDKQSSHFMAGLQSFPQSQGTLDNDDLTQFPTEIFTFGRPPNQVETQPEPSSLIEIMQEAVEEERVPELQPTKNSHLQQDSQQSIRDASSRDELFNNISLQVEHDHQFISGMKDV